MSGPVKGTRTCILKCTESKHMHSFPNDEVGRNVWLKKLGIKRARPTACVCDRHFSSKMTQFGNGVKLTPGAIPDINLSEPEEEISSDESNSQLEIDENVSTEYADLNGNSTNDAKADEMSYDGEAVDFDDILAKVHCISDIKKNNNNNVNSMDVDEFDEIIDEDYGSDSNEGCSIPVRNIPNGITERDLDEDTISAPSTPVEINNKFKRKLVASVRKRRILYDPAHPSFSNIEKKTRSWERIGKIQKLDGTACRELWLNMRYDYQIHVRNLRRWLEGESNQHERPRMPFENDLLFLWRYVIDKSYCDDTDDETRQPRTLVCHVPGIPDVQSSGRCDTSVIDNNYTFAVDHDYANNKTYDCIQFSDKLIEAVRYYPELFDVLHPKFGDAKRKSIIWDAISNEIGEKATKCLLIWIHLQLRYEFDIRHGKSSYLGNKMNFLKKHILNNEKSPFKRCTLVTEEWYEPMNTSKEQHQILQTIITMKKYRPFFATIDEPSSVSRKLQAPCWLAVARSLKRKAEQCETTWVIMQAMYSEVSDLRKNKCPLNDEWEFESVITNLLETISKKTKKYVKSIPIAPVVNTIVNDDICDEPMQSIDEPRQESPKLVVPPQVPLNEITFTIPGDNPTSEPQTVRYNLDTPLNDLPEKSVVAIDSILADAHIVVFRRYKMTPAVYLFTLEKRRELIAEVMARPLLFNQPCKTSRLARIFWGEISKEMVYPVEVCMFFWELVLEKKYFIDYDPAFQKSKGPKWLPTPNPIFEKFQKYADSKYWSEYVTVLPDFIVEISNFPIIYVDLKINSSWSRRQCHARDIAEAWTILARKFAVLENHKVIWDKLKQVFLQYMSEIEVSVYNAWPKFWSPVLEKMKFLHEVRYDPKDPVYYVIRNKIQDEIKESRQNSEPPPPKLDSITNAKAIFGLLKENEYMGDFTWLNAARFIAKMKSFPILYDVNNPQFGNKDDKLDAWQEMALSFHCTVGECHLIFQHLMKSFLIFRARDPNQVCRVNAKYWENMTYIYSCAVPNAIDPKSMEGRTFRVASNGSTIKLAEEYQAEISLVDAKPKLLLKNFAAGVNSLPVQIQASVAQQIKYIYSNQNEEIVVDV